MVPMVCMIRLLLSNSMKQRDNLAHVAKKHNSYCFKNINAVLKKYYHVPDLVTLYLEMLVGCIVKIPFLVKFHLYYPINDL